MSTVKTKLEMLKRIMNGTPDTFLGSKALYQMPFERVAEVTLCRGIHSDRYEGLRLTIIHKHHGEVSQNVFNFEQYLGNDADRSHPNAKNVSKMYVWSNGGFDWYIVRPTTTEPIVAAILEAISFYK